MAKARSYRSKRASSRINGSKLGTSASTAFRIFSVVILSGAKNLSINRRCRSCERYCEILSSDCEVPSSASGGFGMTDLTLPNKITRRANYAELLDQEGGSAAPPGDAE